MREKLAAIWSRIPSPLRVVWDALGWAEDHIGRVTLVVGAVAAAVAGGAVVTGYLSQVEPLWIYVAAFAVLALFAWGVAGIAMFVQTATAEPRPAPTTEPPPAPTKEDPKPQLKGRIRVMPVLVNDEAQLRVENRGTKVSIAAELTRLDNVQSTSVPFRMEWKQEHDFDPMADFFSSARRYRPKPLTTQSTLEVGGLGFIRVAFTEERKLHFPLPGSMALPVGRPESGNVEIEVAFFTNPALEEPHQRVYVLTLDGHAKITGFSERPPAASADRASSQKPSPEPDHDKASPQPQ